MRSLSDPRNFAPTLPALDLSVHAIGSQIRSSLILNRFQLDQRLWLAWDSNIAERLLGKRLAPGIGLKTVKFK